MEAEAEDGGGTGSAQEANYASIPSDLLSSYFSSKLFSAARIAFLHLLDRSINPLHELCLVLILSHSMDNRTSNLRDPR